MRFLLLIITTGILVSNATADIPQIITYQGKVTDTAGAPVADGNYAMRFVIYNAETGGSQLWNSGALAVSVSGGVFSVVLGESPQPTLDLAFNQDYWLETRIGGDIQSPRVQLGSVGYAYMASGVVPGTFVSGNVTGGPGLAALNTATTAESYGLYGATNSDLGFAVAGVASASTGVTYALYGENSSSSGRGVYGWAQCETGLTYGVSGRSDSPSGIGVKGTATATSGAAYGVYGSSASTSGIGVIGAVTATEGTTNGVVGQSSSPTGVGVNAVAFAATGANKGVRGETYSTEGTGILGVASATTGATYGIRGESNSPSGYGVYGLADAVSGTNYGVYGITNSGSGYAGYFQGHARVTGDLTIDGALTVSGIGDITSVNAGTYLTGGATEGDATLDLDVPLSITETSGAPIIEVTNLGTGHGVRAIVWATSGTALYGTAQAGSGGAHGVEGETYSTSGFGVRGFAVATSGSAHGVWGSSNSTSGRGVIGKAAASSGSAYGVEGVTESTEGRGVHGWALASTGVTYGVYGTATSTDGYGVYYSGGLGGTGLMRNIVETSRGPTGLDVHTTAGNWVEDFGEGTLQGGRTHIELDPVFLETVTIDDANPLKVFVQLKDDCDGTYVRPGTTGFDVFESRNGTSNAHFTYRVVAARKGYENRRLEVVAVGQ